MYKATCDGTVIYDQSSDKMERQVASPTLVYEENASGSFTFNLPPMNIGYDKLGLLTSVVDVYRMTNGVYKRIWRGRPISIDVDFNNFKNVCCEGALGFLHDITYINAKEPPYHMSKLQFLKQVLSFYNSKVDEKHKMDFGVVDVPDSPEDIYTNYETVFDIILKYAEDSGKHLKVTYDGETPKIHILSEYTNNESQQTAEFGKNLLDFSKNFDAADLATVIIPRGAPIYRDQNNKDAPKDDIGVVSGDMAVNMYNSGISAASVSDEKATTIPLSEIFSEEENTDAPISKTARASASVKASGTSSSEDSDDINAAYSDEPIGYVTIADVNNGSVYLENSALINLYGRIEKIVDFSETENPSELLQQGKTWLKNYQFNDLTLEISVADLSIKDDGEPFVLCDNIRCVSKPHDMDKYFPITKIELNLDNPADNKITLNKVGASGVSGSSAAIAAAVSDTEKDIQKHGGTILRRAKDSAQELINSCTGGYVTLVPDDTGKYVKEIVISDQVEWTASRNFWRWNKNGLGFFERENPGDPNAEVTDCGLALTMNGEIVADKITTGQMSADRIHGGTLILGDYDDKSGKLQMKNDAGKLIGEWSKKGIEIWNGSGKTIGKWNQDGIEAVGKLQCGNIDAGETGSGLLLSRGILYGYHDGVLQGWLDTSVPILRTGEYDGYALTLNGKRGILLFAPEFGVADYDFDEYPEAVRKYRKGISGTVDVVTNVYTDDDGRLCYNYKQLEFVNGVMVTALE